MIGNHHCSNTLLEAFKNCTDCQYVLFRQGYAECVEASFLHQIQPEYYGDNISGSIKGITLEHFSSTDQVTPS